MEVMTTLHGSTSSPWRRVEGCVPLEGMIASTRDALPHPFYLIEPPQPYRFLYPIRISFLHVGASMDLQSCLGHNWVHLSSLWSLFGVLRDWYMFEFQLGHLSAL